MLEIFLRDRDIDYEMFVFDNEKFIYTTKEKNNQNNALYFGLDRGTIILDGIVLNNSEITLDQVDYIKDILNSFSTIVGKYRKTYKSTYIRYTTGEDAVDLFMNKKVIEIPNRKQFREWVYINAYNYLEKFVYEFEKQKHSKIKNKILNFFNRH